VVKVHVFVFCVLFLQAVGLFCGTGVTRAKVKVFLGDNNSDESQCGKLVGETDQQEFEHTTQNTEPVAIRFKSRIHLLKNTKYTIELDQTNVDRSQSYRTRNGKARIEQDGIVVEITDAVHSPNSTNATNGALPCFHFYRRE